MSELKAFEAAEKEKKAAEAGRGTTEGKESDTDAETVIEDLKEGSKEVEVQPPALGLVDGGSTLGSGSQEVKGSEVSTEDEWERVSETEKDK